MSYRPSSPIAGLPAALDQILVNYLHSSSSVNTNGQPAVFSATESCSDHAT